MRTGVTHKKRITVFLLALAAAVCAVCLLIGLCTQVQAEPLVTDMFVSRGMSLSDSQPLPTDSGYGYTGKTLSFGGKNGAYAEYVHDVSGNWEMNFVPYGGLSGMNVQFTDAEKETEQFTVNLTFGTGVTASVTAAGQTFGLYYQDGGLRSLTRAMNDTGFYTEAGKGTLYETLQFNAQTKQIFVNGIMVWDFSTSVNDGKDVGFQFNGDFQKYNVRITFAQAASQGSALYLASVNGQAFSYPIFHDRAVPQAFVEFVDAAVAGRPYRLPQAYGFDVRDGQVGAEIIELKMNGAAVTAEEGVVTFEEAGECTVTVTAENSAGLSVQKNFTLRVAESGAGEFSVGAAMPQGEIGVNSSVILPAVTYTNALNAAETVFETEVSVFRDGSPVEGVGAETPFTVAEAGEYRVEYRPASDVYAYDVYVAEFTVTSEKPAFSLQSEMIGSYKVGDQISLPAGTFVLGGKDVSAEVAVTFPNGAVYSNRRFAAALPGEYTVEYYAEADGVGAGELYTLRVDVTPESLVTVNDEITLSHGSYSYNTAYSGLIVDTSSSGELTYNRVIDLSKKTRDDAIFSLIVDPSVYGSADFLGINVRLTDIYNADNYLDIRIEAQQNLISNAYANVRIAPPGQTSCGLEGNNIWKGFGGYYIDSSFAAIPASNLPRGCVPVEFYYDYELMRGYGTEFIYHSLNDDLIADLKNRTHFAQQWEGFTTGEVILSITTDGFVNSSGRYILMSVDGISFALPSFADNDAPVIELEKPQAVNPEGAVGFRYPVFAASAIDVIDGETAVNTRVFFDWKENGSDMAELQITDGAFTPQYPGRYKIVYTASDLSGNTAVREEIVTVREKPADILLSFAEEGVETASCVQGVDFALPEVLLSGGSGELMLTKTLAGPGGVSEVLSGDSFRPLKVGTYTVTFTATDYIGHTSEELVLTVSVTAGNTQFLLDEVVLPSVLLNGVAYTLPEIPAVTYGSDGVASEGFAQVFLKNGTTETPLADGAVTPSVENHLDEITLVLRFGEYSEEIAVPVAKPKKEDGSYDLQNIFYSENGNVSFAKNTYVDMQVTSAGENKVWFANKLLADYFTVSFRSLNDTLTAFDIWLVDSVDPDACVRFSITQAADGAALISVNGGTPVSFSGSFAEGGNAFLLQYEPDTKSFVDGSMSGSLKVSQSATGAAWNGFPSGYVYLAFEFGTSGAPAGSGITVQALNGHNFTSAQDGTNPRLVVEDIIGGTYRVGDVVTTPRVWVGDVLGGASVTMTVRSQAAGDAVSDTSGRRLENVPADPCQFTIASAGRYVITYYFTDDAGNSNSNPVVLYAVDETPPTISVSGVPGSVKVGSQTVLPSATATDNDTAAEDLQFYVFAIYENGTMEALQDNVFSPTKAGRYTIRYMVVDAYYNYVFADFTVTVK